MKTENPAEIELDSFVDISEVEKLTTYSRRWISTLIRSKRFPPPEMPGGFGNKPHRWRRSTIKRALDEMQATAAAKHAASTIKK